MRTRYKPFNVVAATVTREAPYRMIEIRIRNDHSAPQFYVHVKDEYIDSGGCVRLEVPRFPTENSFTAALRLAETLVAMDELPPAIRSY